jgi:hypothetical protein
MKTQVTVGTSVSDPDQDWVRIQEGKYEPYKREKSSEILFIV